MDVVSHDAPDNSARGRSNSRARRKDRSGARPKSPIRNRRSRPLRPARALACSNNRNCSGDAVLKTDDDGGFLFRPRGEIGQLLIRFGDLVGMRDHSAPYCRRSSCREFRCTGPDNRTAGLSPRLIGPASPVPRTTLHLASLGVCAARGAARHDHRKAELAQCTNSDLPFPIIEFSSCAKISGGNRAAALALLVFHRARRSHVRRIAHKIEPLENARILCCSAHKRSTEGSRGDPESAMSGCADSRKPAESIRVLPGQSDRLPALGMKHDRDATRACRASGLSLKIDRAKRRRGLMCKI